MSFLKEVTFEMQLVALYTQKVEKKKITFGMIHRYKTHWFWIMHNHLAASDITSEQQQKKLKSANTVKGKQSY